MAREVIVAQRQKTPVHENTKRARSLRIHATSAEGLLWFYLHNNDIFPNFRFKRQKPFPPYFVDFYCYQAKLVIELDGGQHTDPRQVIHDKKRTAFLESKGLRVIRFYNTYVFKYMDGILEVIHSYLEDRNLKSNIFSSF